MEHNGSASNAEKIHQNRLSGMAEDEDQDAALTIVTVLDKVATIVDRVQASQKRIEERHRVMGNSIKSVQIDLLKLSQSHSNTGYVINKLFEKTRKVSAHIKDVKARVEKQQVHVTKVETKQEEIMKKNKFRVVIFQVSLRLGLPCLLLQPLACFHCQQVPAEHCLGAIVYMHVVEFSISICLRIKPLLSERTYYQISILSLSTISCNMNCGL